MKHCFILFGQELLPVHLQMKAQENTEASACKEWFALFFCQILEEIARQTQTTNYWTRQFGKIYKISDLHTKDVIGTTRSPQLTSS